MECQIKCNRRLREIYRKALVRRAEQEEGNGTEPLITEAVGLKEDYPLEEVSEVQTYNLEPTTTTYK